jgi:hypothetical protein
LPDPNGVLPGRASEIRTETVRNARARIAQARPCFSAPPNPCTLSRMTPEEFIDKWRRADRTGRQAAQEHVIDLCRVRGEPTPNEAADPGGYSFEKGVSKRDGASGFADVWKRGHFGWEYKKDRANLHRAYQQLQRHRAGGRARLSRPHPAEERGGGGRTEEAHARQPLQRAPAMTRRRAPRSRRRGRRRLRLVRRHFRGRRAGEIAGIEPVAGWRSGAFD